jgi:dynactin complex subunit
MELQRLNNWSETKKAFDMLKDEYDEKIDNLRERLQDKQNEAHEHHENMVNYIWKVFIQTHTI